ncbi:MAG: DUF4160 domain-containing protein [Gammaproteobacteria bacterium]
MPSISRFYGIIIWMHFFDDGKRHLPHFHAQYNERGAVISIKDGAVLSGSLPPPQMKMVQEWTKVRRAELAQVWDDLTKGKESGRIPPLK